MAARKKQTTPKSDGEGQASESVADTGPGDIAVDEQFADSSAPHTPTGKIRVRGADDDPRPRVGGYVLTEKGWQVE